MSDNDLFQYSGNDCMVDTNNERWKDGCYYYQMHNKLKLCEKIREFFYITSGEN